MGRYLAAVAHSSGDPAFAALIRTAETSLGLRPAFATARLSLLIGGDIPIARLGDATAVVGRIYARDAGDAPLVKPASAALIEDAWGDYVAFACAPGGGVTTALRSPSGGLAAYRAGLGTISLISSDVELLLGLGVSSEIDWQFVAQHLTFSHLRGRATGLAAVDEIVPGELLTLANGHGSSAPLWSPWRFAEPSRQIDDFRQATTLLRATVQAVTRTLASEHASILLELSGGLDSSIVAASLDSAQTNVTALNLVTPGAEGDERRYARLVAAMTGIPVRDRIVPDGIDLTRLCHERTPRPGMPAMLATVEDCFIDAARVDGIDAFLSGTGGDSVFCSLSSTAPAADAWRRGKLGRAYRAARDVAEIHGANPWRIAWQAIRLARRGRPALTWPRATMFMRENRLPIVPTAHHWLDEPPGTLPGTRMHVRSIMAALAHLDGYARHAVAPSLFPLLAQPVIETVLRIPTWLWVTGGRDRAAAREAFRDLLPLEVVERRTKGAMDALCARIFQANRKRLRPFLCDGWLARREIVDADAVAAYLDAPGPLRDTRFYRLLPLADTERWLRAWLGEP